MGLAVAAYLGLFALDAVREGALALAVHAAPALLVLGLVVAAWRRPGLGAIAFGALAAGYALAARERPDWVLAVSGPLALVAALHVAGWRASRLGTPAGA